MYIVRARDKREGRLDNLYTYLYIFESNNFWTIQ